MSGFEQEFPGRVKTFNVDATTSTSQQAVRFLGFDSHGLVIHSSTDEVLWKQADHYVNVNDARKALSGLVSQ